jgi:hypothetical protein
MAGFGQVRESTRVALRLARLRQACAREAGRLVEADPRIRSALAERDLTAGSVKRDGGAVS